MKSFRVTRRLTTVSSLVVEAEDEEAAVEEFDLRYDDPGMDYDEDTATDVEEVES